MFLGPKPRFVAEVRTMRVHAPLRRTAQFFQPKTRGVLIALASALVVLPVTSFADSKAEARYPYDPACAWGRIANGKGMLHRCLTKDEAARVAHDAKSKSKSSAQDSDEKRPAKKNKDAGSIPAVREFDLNVGPISADKGEITIGRLGKPVDRYRKCITEHGGLQAKDAKVVVKFLVRAERVRAEGVSVDSRSGVSKRAAKCLADVVDRRKVGVPSVPFTAARLTFTVAEK